MLRKKSIITRPVNFNTHTPLTILSFRHQRPNQIQHELRNSNHITKQQKQQQHNNLKLEADFCTGIASTHRSQNEAPNSVHATDFKFHTRIPNRLKNPPSRPQNLPQGFPLL
jgi:hypothetical protein